VLFHGIKDKNGAWDKGRFIFFDINGKTFKTLTSRLGSGPFPLLIQKSRTLEESKAGKACEVLFDVVAQPNPDRSVTFHPVKGRDGSLVYF
jgi:hypothetical protein